MIGLYQDRIFTTILVKNQLFLGKLNIVNIFVS